MSASAGGGSAAASQSASADAWRPSADASRAESATRRKPDGGASPSGTAVAMVGASSTIACAFVPEKPNAESPARLGAPGAGVHGRAAVLTTKAEPSSRTSGFGASACRVGGMVLCRSESSTLASPATPAAAVVWPTLLLIVPSAQNPASGVRAPKAATSPAASIGSPSLVPVPCASSIVTVRTGMRARSSTSPISAACAAAEGAVMPFVRPSWLRPVARITPYTWSRSASARASGFSTTAPAPSAGAMPSAAAPKARQRPVGESMPARLICLNGHSLR